MSKVAVYAREVDANQKTTQMFWPVDDPAQLQACQPNVSAPQEVHGTLVP